MSLGKKSVIRGLYDDYRIVSELAIGGMATVSTAINSKGQEVVIKIPKIVNDGMDDIRLDKLRVEASILKVLSGVAHENNIVRYIDESTQGNSFYLIIEKINGKTLKEMIKNGVFDERTAIKYLQVLLSSLKHIHAKNVIHRDIKPANIIVDPRRGPILIDFGAAKLGWTQMKTGQETIIGTVGWSCPDQFKGNASTSCDIYSAGAILYFLLTGSEPKTNMNSAGRLIISPKQTQHSISNTTSELLTKTLDPEHKSIITADDMMNSLQNNKSQIIPPIIVHPYVVLNGIKHEVKDEINIGRNHDVCDEDCKNVGFAQPPSIPIDEVGPYNFLSKHHIRIWKDIQNQFWIQDLRSKNGTAINKGGRFTLLLPGQRERLYDGNIVALCFSNLKGAYITFTFHER